MHFCSGRRIVLGNKYKNFVQRLTMPLPELEAYYRERRKERFEKALPFAGVKLRKILHPVLVWGMKGKHILDKQKVTILGDKRIHNLKNASRAYLQFKEMGFSSSEELAAAYESAHAHMTNVLTELKSVEKTIADKKNCSAMF